MVAVQQRLAAACRPAVPAVRGTPRARAGVAVVFRLSKGLAPAPRLPAPAPADPAPSFLLCPPARRRWDRKTLINLALFVGVAPYLVYKGW
jgi:hypothetical protein